MVLMLEYMVQAIYEISFLFKIQPNLQIDLIPGSFVTWPENPKVLQIGQDYDHFAYWPAIL